MEEELARFEAAEKIPAAEFDDADGCFHGDRYFPTVDDAMQDFDEMTLPEDGLERPRYLWAATGHGIPKADLEDITGNLFDNMWPDADEGDLNGIAELGAALQAFNDANAGIRTYEVDYGRAIIL